MASTTADEASLVSRARERDGEAFWILVSRYRQALERILRPIAGDPDTARDLVQDATLRAFKNLHLYRADHRFSTWFFRIGINLAISKRRRQKLDQRVRQRLAPPDADALPGPVESTLLREDGERLARAIRRLPDRYQEIIRLRYSDELSCKEIARRMDTTPNSVSIVLFRAKQKLRKDLERP